MAWLGNGNVVAEFTDEGDSTTYMDFTDISKVLVVPTKDYKLPDDWKPAEIAHGVSKKQQEALNNVSTTPVPNTALDPDAPAETKIAASAETVPLGSPVITAEQFQPKKIKKFY